MYALDGGFPNRIMSRQLRKSLWWFSSSSTYLAAASGRGIEPNLPVIIASDCALKQRLDTCHSSCFSESTEPTRRMIESGLGKILTEFVRRLISFKPPAALCVPPSALNGGCH